jgi:small subunit ribosomal protein S16
VIEELGYFDPIAPEDKQLNLKVERVAHWLKVGAQPSDTARSLIRRAGIEVKPSDKAARAIKAREKAGKTS